MASGILDVRKMLNFGINVCLGTGRLYYSTVCYNTYIVEYNLKNCNMIYSLYLILMYVTVVYMSSEVKSARKQGRSTSIM